MRSRTIEIIDEPLMAALDRRAPRRSRPIIGAGAKRASMRLAEKLQANRLFYANTPKPLVSRQVRRQIARAEARRGFSQIKRQVLASRKQAIAGRKGSAGHADRLGAKRAQDLMAAAKAEAEARRRAGK